jgi:UDP-N-acetylglucosamine acyltransferase
LLEMMIDERQNRIDPGALISPRAKIGRGNHFSSYSVVLDDVEIGDRNYFAPGVVVGGSSRQRLGRLAPLEIVPEPRSDPKVLIGSDNVLLECVSVHLPMERETRIGDRISIGAHTHIGHDVRVDDDAVISISVSLGGFVIVSTGANIGLGASVHPRVVLGEWVMVGMSTSVIQNVSPGVIVAGVPARVLGINYQGLDRHKVGRADRLGIEALFEQLTMDQAQPDWSSCEVGSRFEETLKGQPRARELLTKVKES